MSLGVRSFFHHHYETNTSTTLKTIKKRAIVQSINQSINVLFYVCSENGNANNTHAAQYADDIAINTTLRKHTNKRVVSYVQKLYQSEMNKLIAYMKENGFELSRE